MAVNEKIVYATSWTCHGGKIYRPGDQLTGRMPDHAVRGAVEQGLTGSHADGQRAASAEAERQARVAEQQRTRAEKREPEERG